MPKVEVNDIEIYYETMGDPSGKPLLLVMGQGAQMIRWNEEFCKALVERGFYVIRYDNRDIGLSTSFADFGKPNLWEIANTINSGGTVEAPYTLEDMADDGIGLLDVLNIEKAHIAGVSMGGMIVQVMAYRHPERVASLTSIMSGTGKKGLPYPEPEVIQLFHKEAPPDTEGYVNHMVSLMRSIYGSYPFDEETSKEIFRKCIERSYRPGAFTRHYLAILVNGDRTDKLASVDIPALVIHGKEDSLVKVEHGIQTAESIPNAELLLIDKMGHSLPPEAWDRIIDAMENLAKKAQSKN